MPAIPRELLFAGVYAMSLAAVAFVNQREFMRSPQKRERYVALPLRYKLLCWFVVAPLFAGIVLQGWLLGPALVAFLLVESACVRWYRKAGLLP